MTNISIEVKNDDSTFTVEARAKSIEHAVKNLYSTNEAKVVFPAEPESFFVNGGAESIRRESGQADVRDPTEPGESVSGAKAGASRKSGSSAPRLPAFTDVAP